MAIVSDSSQVGYLQPIAEELNDLQLEDLLQDVLVNLSALDSEFVRPAYQETPPPIPNPSTNWLAFHVTSQQTNKTNETRYINDTAVKGFYQKFTVAISCYGNKAQFYANNIIDSLQLHQNRDVLTDNKIVFHGSTDTINATEIIANKWFRRVDFNIDFERVYEKTYGVKCLTDLNGIIQYADSQDPFLVEVD